MNNTAKLTNAQLPQDHAHNLVQELNSIGMRCNICQWRLNPQTGEWAPPLEDDNSPLIG
jgi:hypothetical protein